MPEATGAYGLLPGRGPGRGLPRPGVAGRGAPGRGAPGAAPPGPGRGAAGRGAGAGPREGAAGAGDDGAPSVGTGGTGARGGAVGPPDAAGRAASPAAGAAGPGVAGLAAGGASACADWVAGPSAAGACGRAGPGRGAARPPLPSDWAGAAGAAAAARLPWGFGPWAANSSLSLRTTGASTVEDAERTNSPISWSLAITALLSTPNSFASSYTRTFATALPLSARLHRALVADPGQSVLRTALASGSHRRVLIARSSQLIPLSRHCCRSCH
jgi:hypothetical protein